MQIFLSGYKKLHGGETVKIMWRDMKLCWHVVQLSLPQIRCFPTRCKWLHVRQINFCVLKCLTLNFSHKLVCPFKSAMTPKMECNIQQVCYILSGIILSVSSQYFLIYLIPVLMIHLSRQLHYNRIWSSFYFYSGFRSSKCCNTWKPLQHNIRAERGFLVGKRHEILMQDLYYSSPGVVTLL